MRRPLLINGALLALALGTFGLVWATRDAPTTGDLLARKNQLFSELVLDQVDGVQLTRGKEQLELRREGGEFQIVKPWRERADVATINKWLTAADMAQVERPADGVSPEQAGFGPEAYRASLQMGSRKLELTLGGPAPTPTGARYAQVKSNGSSQVFVVRGSVASELELPFDTFRETRLLEYGRRELKRISLQSPAGTVELEQREHGAFFVKVGSRWELARPAALRVLSEQLARLSSELFVEPEQARAALTAADATAVRLKLEPLEPGAAPVSLSLGGKCPKAVEQALVLREQAGRAPRASCIDASLVDELKLEPEAVRLRGPFQADADEVEELQISRGAHKLDLARKDRAFVLRAPSRADVPLRAGNQRLEAILSAEGELAPSDAVPAAGTGELTIQIAGGDPSSHREERVVLGPPRPDKSVCFRRLADGVTRCVKAAQAAELEPDARLLRSLSVLDFAPSQLASFSVETPGLKQRVVRNSDGTYRLEQPAGYAHDAARVADAVQSLGTLEAERWLAPADAAATGFEPPSLRVTIQLASPPETRELVVGARLPGGYYARLTPDPAVFVLGGALLEALQEPLIERSLCPFPDADVRDVTYRRAGQPPRAADGRLRETLVSLRATGVSHLGAPRAAEGFGAPGLTLEYASTQGQLARVLIGVCEPGDTARCYARRDGVDATFTLEGELARTFKDLLRP